MGNKDQLDDIVEYFIEEVEEGQKVTMLGIGKELLSESLNCTENLVYVRDTLKGYGVEISVN